MMLSEKSEKFLRELRIELLYRGKKDEEVYEIEDELRDHLIHAEENGDSVDNITGGSPKAYIKSISNEMSFDRTVIKSLIGGLFVAIGFFIISPLIEGHFTLTIGNILTSVVSMLVSLLLFLIAIKWMVVKLGNQNYNQLMLILGAGTVAVVIHAIGARISNSYPIMTLFSLSPSLSLTIGITIFALLLIGTAITKSWVLFFMVLISTLPELLAKLFTGKTGSESDFIFFTVSLFIIFVFITILVSFYRNWNKIEVNNDEK